MLYSVNARPLVTIVTPVLNGANHIRETLASVRSQDYPSIEHIVVDGGSTDGTLDILRASGVRWVSGSDRGMYDAINKGFRLARGEIIAYQNADDRYIAPGAVSAAVACLLDNPKADVVYGDFRYIRPSGEPTRSKQFRGRTFAQSALRRYNFVPPHSTFVRRRIVSEEGYWLDPNLHFAGDWDWFLRLAEAGKIFVHLPQVLSEFRIHDRSMTSSIGWKKKIDEWHCICRRQQISLTQLLLNEAFLMPLARRFGCRV